MTNLYTVIMEYLGGTYISQIEANNNTQAIKLWIENLAIDEITGFSEDDKKNIIKNNFKDDEPILLNGIRNVWCVNVRTNNGLGIIHLIKTNGK